MKDTLLDIRYALRVLWKSPTFTLVAFLTLLLGIGANVVVFGVVNALLLQPLAVRDAQDLYQVRLQPWTNWKPHTTSYPAFQDYQQRNTTFRELAGLNRYNQARLDTGRTTRRVQGCAVTGNYFEMLGVQPQLGRLIRRADDQGLASAPYVVLSDALWRSAFQADPGVLGTTVRLNKEPFTVIGVTPPQFHGTEKFIWPDYYIPFVNDPAGRLVDRTAASLVVLGHVKPGVSPRQAAENLSAIAAQLAREYPASDTGMPLRLIRPGLFGDHGDVIRGFLYGVSGLALLVLVAACFNLANLFSARAAERGRELAIRVALGASQWRLVRQILTEALVLALAGGGAGLLCASLLLLALNRWPSPYGQMQITLDPSVYLIALALTLVSTLLFGLMPARQVRQSSPVQAMKTGPAEAPPWRRLGLRDLLLLVQIAICMLLVVSSLVAARAIARLLDTPLGFQAQGALLASVDLSLVDGGNVPLETKKAMLDAVRSLPGVTAVGAINQAPLTGSLRGVPVFPPGTTEFTLNHSLLSAYAYTIAPGYLQAAPCRLHAGRDVSWQDTTGTPPVALVNQTFARQMWGDSPALGRRFLFQEQLREVVGVVEDGRYEEMTESPQPAVFVPLSQNAQRWPTLVVRSPRAPSELAPELERVLRALAPEAQVSVQSWPEAMAWAMFPPRGAAAALGTMSALAALLAVTGLFGMAAYNVSRRMKEIGLRVALGARARHVLSAAVGRPLALLATGSVLGLLTGLLATPLLAQVVHQASPRDGMVMLGALLVMTVLGSIACAVPALRALAVDPSKLMRDE